MSDIISIVFTRPKKKFNIVSRLIRFVTSSKFSHVAIIFPKTAWLEHDIVAEANHLKTRVCKLDYFLKPNEIVHSFHIPVSKECRRRTFNACMKEMGKDYGFVENLGIVIAKTFGLKKNPLGSNDERTKCSEFVYHVLVELNPLYKTSKDIDLITPKDIYRLLGG